MMWKEAVLCFKIPPRILSGVVEETHENPMSSDRHLKAGYAEYEVVVPYYSNFKLLRYLQFP